MMSKNNGQSQDALDDAAGLKYRHVVGQRELVSDKAVRLTAGDRVREDGRGYGTFNEYYHIARKRDLMREEIMRASVRQLGFPIGGDDAKAQVIAEIVLDYRSELDEPGSPMRYAYGACLLFENLSFVELQALERRVKDENGIVDSPGTDLFDERSAKRRMVEVEAIKELLARDDIISLFYDSAVMANPGIAQQFGEFKHYPYDHDYTPVNGVTPYRIMRFLADGPSCKEFRLPSSEIERQNKRPATDEGPSPL